MDGPGASTPISIAASAICASIFTISMVSMGFFSFMGIGKSEVLCRKCSSPALISRESSEDDTCCQPKIHTRGSSLVSFNLPFNMCSFAVMIVFHFNKNNKVS